MAELYVDEAQDCHSYEKRYFFALFSPQKSQIASGGKEQLTDIQMCVLDYKI
jgi:hypothetical protein